MRQLFLTVKRDYSNEPKIKVYADLLDAYSHMLADMIDTSPEIAKALIVAKDEKDPTVLTNFAPTKKAIAEWGADRICNDEKEEYVFWMPENSESANFRNYYSEPCVLEASADNPVRIKPVFIVVYREGDNLVDAHICDNLRDACVLQTGKVMEKDIKKWEKDMPKKYVSLAQKNLSRTGRFYCGSTPKTKEAYIFVLPGKNAFR